MKVYVFLCFLFFNALKLLYLNQRKYLKPELSFDPLHVCIQFVIVAFSNLLLLLKKQSFFLENLLHHFSCFL